MKKFIILFLLLFTTVAYASNYNTEYIVNKVYDSTNTAFRATISGSATMTSISADTLIVMGKITADTITSDMMTVDTLLQVIDTMTADIIVVNNITCDSQFVANKVTADMIEVTSNITADTVSPDRLLIPHSAISPDGVGHGGGFSAPMGAMHYDKNTNILWINTDASEDWYGVQFLDSI